MGVVVEYDNNNSGGRWWLTTEDYENLEKAGWNVHWVQPKSILGGPGRSVDSYKDPLLPQTRYFDTKYLGCDARSAAKEFDDPGEAITEWERITGKNASDIGCTCCGPPHEFEYTDEEGRTHYATGRVVTTDISFS